MPIVIDRNPARLAAFAAMGAGAQARRMDDSHLVSQALRDAAILREGDQRQQQIDQSQQAQQFHQQDIQGLRQLQEQQRQQMNAAIGAPPAAPGGVGANSGAIANGGNRPPGAASFPDLSNLDPEMQMRVVEHLRQQAQDQQDVQNAQFAVEQATRRGVFGDFDSMDGLSRAATMANLAKSGPAGARQVMAVIARREQEMEQERRAQEQQDRLDERAMETQRHEDYRAELGQVGQTARTMLSQGSQNARNDASIAQRREAASATSKRLTDDRVFQSLKLAVDAAEDDLRPIQDDLKITPNEITADATGDLQLRKIAAQQAQARVRKARAELQEYLAKPKAEGQSAAGAGSDADSVLEQIARKLGKPVEQITDEEYQRERGSLR